VAIIASATGYQSANTSVQVGVPQLEMSVPTSVYTTTPDGQITVYARDQAGNERVVLDPLTVSLVSSDPNVASVDSATITLLPGTSRHSGARMDFKTPGATTLTATDTRANVTIQRYMPKSERITVSTPPVQVYYGQAPLAVGQYRDNFLYIPHNTTTPLTVTVTRTNPSVADLTTQNGASTTLTIPAGQNSVYFRMLGKAEGTDNITFSVAGHATSAPYVQEVSKGTFDLSGWQGTIRTGQRQQLRLYVRNRTGSGMPIAAATTFALASNASVRLVDASGAVITGISIPAGREYSDVFYVEGVSQGTGQVTVTHANYTTLTEVIAVTSAQVAQQ
jgi:hypothetical protein